MNRWSALLVLVVGLGCSKSQKVPTGSLDEAKKLYDQGQYPAAIAECDKAIAKGDGAGPAHLLRGKCHEKLGADSSAITDYSQARGLDPKLTEAYCREARLDIRAMKVDQAQIVLDGASPVGAADVFYIRTMQGEVHLAAGAPDPARKVLKEATEMAGSVRDEMAVAIAYYNLSFAHFQMASFRQARTAYEQYIDSKKRTGAEIDGDDRYTEMVLRLMSGDLPGAQEIAKTLPDDRKPQAEALLAGNALSIRELFDPPKNSDRR